MAESGLSRRLFKHVPALDSLRHYSWSALGGDLSAGLTVATVALPQAMAYAILAGVPPQYGLYTAIVMTTVGALLDSSKLLINGPTNAISIAVLSALGMVPDDRKIAAVVVLTFLVGSIQLGIALLHLGDLTRYVSHSVIVGFTLGAGTLIFLDQSRNLLGLGARGSADDHFLKRLWLSLTTGNGIHWITLAVGVGTIVIVLLVRRFNDYCRARGARFPIPQHLAGVVFMSILVWAFDLHERHGVEIVGAIPPSLPRFALPDLRWDDVRHLAGNAFAIAVLGLLEAVAMAKAIAGRTGQHLDINQQCLSEGAANMVGSFFQCMPGSGSLTRSSINQQAGAVSQWSGVFSAIAVAITVLLAAPLARYIPRSALAGLLLLAAFRLVDRKQLVFHLRATRFDAGVVLATALAAVVISVEFCIIIGVFLSFVLYMPKAAQVRLVEFTRLANHGFRERQAGDLRCDRLHMYALEGDLFFGVEPELEKHFAAIDEHSQADVRAVILILKRTRNPDAAFLGLLQELHARLTSHDVALVLAAVQSDLHKALAATGLDVKIGPDKIFPEPTHNASATNAAIDFAYGRIGDDLCASCPRRRDKASPPADEPIVYEI
jgi:SulP family sulfate permease